MARSDTHGILLALGLAVGIFPVAATHGSLEIGAVPPSDSSALAFEIAEARLRVEAGSGDDEETLLWWSSLPSRGIGSGRAGLRDLRGGFLVEVIGGSLGMGGCRENGAVVVLENFQPSRDIGGVFFPRLLMQFEIGTQESRAKLGNKFFAAVTFIAPLLAAKVAVEALRVLRPVCDFVSKSGVVALSIAEGFKGRHLHVIQFLRVVGTISAVFDRCSQAGEKLLRMFYACHGITASEWLSRSRFRASLRSARR